MSNIVELKPYEREVYYYETDRMNIVHHSNYIKWLEEARNDFMKQIGYPFAKIEAQNLMVPVLNVSCEYEKPLRFGDTYQIKLIPTVFNGIRFEMDYEIYNKENGERYATAHSGHCFVDLNMMPVILKHEHADIYEAFLPYFPEKKRKRKVEE